MTNTGFVAYARERLEPLGATFRRMFGGHGIYLHGVMFALIADDVLYFKTNAAGTGAFEAEASVPFSYPTKTGDKTIPSYWSVPEHVLEDETALAEWVARAAAVAAETQKKPRKKPRKKKPRARR